MSLWARYIAELRGGKCQFLEYEWGFISYSYPEHLQDAVMVEDVFVVPEQRDAAHAYLLHNEVVGIAAAAGKRRSIFIVRTDSPLAANNLRIYLALGFVPIAAANGEIYLSRNFDNKE